MHAVFGRKKHQPFKVFLCNIKYPSIRCVGVFSSDFIDRGNISKETNNLLFDFKVTLKWLFAIFSFCYAVKRIIGGGQSRNCTTLLGV